MYELFKNIAEKNSCQLRGVCSIHPTLNLLNYALLLEIKEASFYLVKLKELGITNCSNVSYIIEILSIFLINTNYNQKKYLNIIKNLSQIKKEARDKYVEYCTQNNIPYETIQVNSEVNNFTTISELISYAQNKLVNFKDSINEDKLKLFELIVVIAKFASIDVSKLKKFDKNNTKYDYEIIRFFALSNSFSIRNDKIIRRILKFSDLFFEIKKELLSTYENNYGKKETVKISTELKEGHNILISGSDLFELEKVLKILEEENYEEKINVYTHGAMILANLYPYFKNNKFLIGHYGDNNIEYDFSSFQGVILLTQNFIQKIDGLYRGEIFSNKIISFEKTIDINDYNYLPLIKTSLNTQGFKDIKNNSNPIEILYDSFDEIIKQLKENEEAIVIIGNQEFDLKDNDKKIINIKCPIEDDVLLKLIEFSKENKIKLTLFFSECNLFSLSFLLTLLNKEVELNIANCPNVLISPHIIEILKNNFRVETI